MKNQKIIKQFLLLVILILSTLLIYFFHFVKGDEKIFTHFFYAPIILAAFWFKFNVIWVVVYLSFALVLTDLYTGDLDLVVNDLFRSAFFMAVGLTVAFLREKMIFLSVLRKYRDVISAIQEPVLILDRNMSIVIANDRFRYLFGGNASVFSDITQKLEHKDRAALRAVVKKCFGGRVGEYSCLLTTESNGQRYFDINSYPINEGDSIENIVLNMKDSTEKRNVQNDLQLTVDRKRTMIDVLQLINRDISDSDVLDSILKLIKEKTGASVLGMRLKTEKGYRLYGVSGMDENLVRYFDQQCRLAYPEKAEETDFFCICKYCMDNFTSADNGSGSRKTFRTGELNDFAASRGGALCPGLHGYKSCMLMPLCSDNEVIGFIVAMDERENLFGDEMTAFFEGIVPSFEIALHRMRYENMLKEMLEEKELLLKEVHHRVKNNMQIITSLISLQASRQDDEKICHVLNDCQNRVRTMALVHEKLYNSEDFSSIDMRAYTEGLVSLLMRSCGISQSMLDVQIDVSGISMGLNTAIPLAQLMNELVTNTFKHAFSGPEGGRLEVYLSRTGEGENSYSLIVRDNGPGLPAEVSYPEKGNLGFQLIYALVRQLKGKLDIDCSSGTSVEIFFTDML